MVKETSDNLTKKSPSTTYHLPPTSFVHLHNHSEYSLLDGASRITDIVYTAKIMGQPAIALTDHGVMYGIIKFYQEALKQSVKPIIGCEVYVAQKSRFDKSQGKEDNPYHLTLLAADNTGYKNLMKLCSLGFLDGFYYKPRVDLELIKELSTGIVALSGCVTGMLSKLILAGREKEAKEKAKALQSIYKDNFYIELQNQKLEEQASLNKKLNDLAKELGIPTVATNDAHYVKKEDAVAQDVLLCIQTGSVIEAEDRLKFSTPEFYLKSAEEMELALGEYPEALANTSEIAEKCNVEIELGKTFLPKYQQPKGLTLESYLEKLCYEHLSTKYKTVTKEIKERLNYELEVIKKTGFAAYFLIVWDFVNYAKSQGIKVGPGRGSAAGSIVSYVLDITTIDPIKHGLLFERFLNPERISMPDIDIDFCYERRNEVIDYVAKKYGQDKVAQIITFGTMAARAATRDAGRVFNIPYGTVDKLAKKIPETLGITIKEALVNSADLKEVYDADEVTRKILDTASGLEGLVRQDSIHAAGVVIAANELTKHTPIQRKGESELVTQYPMEDIQKIGLLKMDFLGLRTLTVINNTCETIKRNKGEKIDIENVPLSDGKTFNLLRRGETVGIFQLESSGMRSLLKDLKPSNFSDVVAILALYRPGPLGSGMVKDFVERKHGKQPIKYLHSTLESILKETYGIIVYQEQVMQIASTLANFSMAEADILRKAMSKKEPEVLKKQREKFVYGSSLNKIDKKTAGYIFDLVSHFAGYGFNKSHSTAYAAVSYQTAYLKAHYPVEFMAALLTSVQDNKDKVASFVNECSRLKIEVLPPDVNLSGSGFTAVGKTIRFGLSAVRNVGSAAIEAIVSARNNKGKFSSVTDFCEKADLSVINKRCMESLIKAGAFDSLGYSRAGLLEVFEQIMDRGDKRQKDMSNGQFSLFDSAEGTHSIFKEEVPDKEMEKGQLLAFEKEMLGLYVSGHPLKGLEGKLEANSDISLIDIKEEKDGSVKKVAGIVSNMRTITTRKGDLMAFIVIEDVSADLEVIVFPSLYQQYKELLAEDKIICIKGRLDRKENESKLIALEIEEVSQNEEKIKKPVNMAGKALLIRLNPQQCRQAIIQRLKEILRKNPGQTPVMMELAQNESITKLKIGPDLHVRNNSRLIAELKELLGPGAVFEKDLSKQAVS